jgi:deferrochelatase/peroxidase EfeB
VVTVHAPELVTGPLLAEIQGNIVRGYGLDYTHVRHLVLEVRDRDAAQAAVADLLDASRSGLELTSGATWPDGTGPEVCVNLGFTAVGLEAMGVSRSQLDTFPLAFRQGMAARRQLLGDAGPSAPENWVDELRDPHRVHALLTLHSGSLDAIERGTESVEMNGRAWAPVGNPLDGRALSRVAATGADDDRAASDGSRWPDQTTWADARSARAVHFGYLDGMSQPLFDGLQVGDGTGDARQFTPLGAVLLGFRTSTAHVRWRTPEPHPLGRSGTFNAFRMLDQDVWTFHRLLEGTAAAHGLEPALVAAKLCGRYPDGQPLSERHGHITYADDPDGARCPIGAHIRRANPRDSVILQRATNLTRRLVRRGMPYGPPIDPAAPDDGVSRGLLGNFLCADLGGQFEALQNNWINLGFQDPRITGTNDPLVGHHDRLDPPFVFVPDPDGGDERPISIPTPPLVRTAGGAYTFLPSMAGLRWLADGCRA